MSPWRDSGATTVTAKLRALLLDSAKTLLAPGASDPLSARLIESHGYKCVYIGSYATAASRFAMPDTGRLSLDQLAAHARSICAVVRIPVIADAEAFDDAVPAFEAAGVSAIHIEDHTGAGKHTNEPQTLRSVENAAERIRAAVAARTNPDFLIVARSDAYWINKNLEECVTRLQRYAAAGADMVFPTMVGPRELAEVRRKISKPLMVVNNAENKHPGAAIVLYYAFSVAAQFNALKRALADRKLAAETRPLEDFLGYKGSSASGRRRK